jgi:hypothetical protein
LENNIEMATEPIQLEIVAHVLGSLNHCTHCQVFIDGVGVGGQIKRVDLEAYPREFMEEWQRLSDWILALSRRYAGQLVIKITDAQSPQALWKRVRYGVRRYPTFIVEGENYEGWAAEAELMARLNQLLAERNQPLTPEQNG